MSLALNVFGAVQATWDGELLKFATEHARALLVYLAVEADVIHPRTTVATLLWPDEIDVRARHNLRQALFFLKQALRAVPMRDALLQVTATTLQWNSQGVAVDLHAYQQQWRFGESHTHAGLQHCATCMEHFSQALALYRGEFLHDLFLKENQLFEEWTLLLRERCHRQAMAMLGALIPYSLAIGATEQAVQYATRQVALEPWHEEGHRHLMQALAFQGQQNAALRHYESCRRILLQELGVPPSPETTKLYEEIRSGRLAGEHPPVAAPTLYDWNEMPVVDLFAGRATEVAQLTAWLAPAGREPQQRADKSLPHVQVISVLGMGGIGKTTLAAAVTSAVAPNFAVVIWRSLINSPTPGELLHDWLNILARHTMTAPPATLDEQLRLLIEYLRNERCLLVLDNVESIFTAGEPQGHAGVPRSGYEGYDQIFQRLATSAHQSCLLLTSREQLYALARLGRQAQETTGRLRELALVGLDLEAAHQVLQSNGLHTAKHHTARLVKSYSGNPLALQIVAATIADFFGGDVTAFQQQEGILFDSIRMVLDQQFARLSDLEREIIVWLAIEREAVSVGTLRDNLVQPPAQRLLLEAIRTLQRRSLLLQQGDGFTLQNVVIEYLTEHLIEHVCDELLQDDQWNALSAKPHTLTALFLNRFALLKTQVKEHVRQSQARLILQPVAECLLARLSRSRVITQIHAILTWLRSVAPLTPGYAAGNLLNLLLYLRVDLAGYDFSRLSVWQADLRGVTVADLNFAEADLTDSAFTLDFSIFAMIFDRLGQILLAAPLLGDICLWRVVKGQVHDAYQRPSQGAFPLVFSLGGQFMAGGCLDHTIRLWSVESGDLLHSLQGHTELIHDLAFSPDAQQLASSSDDNTIRLWDLRSGQCLRILSRESRGHTRLTYQPASQGPPLLACGGRDRTIHLWGTEQGQLVALLHGHQREIESMTFSPDGTLLASAGHDGTILLWDVRVPEQSQLLAALEGHSQVVRALAFHPNSQLLASGSSDCTIRLWDVNSRQTRQLLVGHANDVVHLAFNPDGSTLASSSVDRVLWLWDTQTGRALEFLHGYIDTVNTVRFSPDGRQLASGSADGLIRLWQRQQERPIRYLQGHEGQVLTVAYCPAPIDQEGQGISLLASGSIDKTVQLWNLATGQPVRTMRGHTGPVKTVAFRGDGQLLASGSADRTIRLWPVTEVSGRAAQPRERILRGHTDEVATVMFSPDGQRLVSSSYDHTARLWLVESGQELYVLQGHTAALCAAVFNPKGDHVATITYDNTVVLWKVTEGRCTKVWEGSGAGGRVAAFNPAGDLLIHSSEQTALVIRDVHHGQILHTLRGHRSTIVGLDFNPSEPLLVSSSWDGTIRLWDLQTGDCLQTLHIPGPYAGMNITGVTGITKTQTAALKALGAVDSDVSTIVTT